VHNVATDVEQILAHIYCLRYNNGLVIDNNIGYKDNPQFRLGGDCFETHKVLHVMLDTALPATKQKFYPTLRLQILTKMFNLLYVSKFQSLLLNRQ